LKNCNIFWKQLKKKLCLFYCNHRENFFWKMNVVNTNVCVWVELNKSYDATVHNIYNVKMRVILLNMKNKWHEGDVSGETPHGTLKE